MTEDLPQDWSFRSYSGQEIAFGRRTNQYEMNPFALRLLKAW